MEGCSSFLLRPRSSLIKNRAGMQSGESRAGRAARMISGDRPGDRRAAPAPPRPDMILFFVRPTDLPRKVKRQAPPAASSPPGAVSSRCALRAAPPPVYDPLTVRGRSVGRASPSPLCSAENMVFVRSEWRGLAHRRKEGTKPPRLHHEGGHKWLLRLSL